MLFQTCTKLTFGLSDVLVATFTARNRVNSVGSLLLLFFTHLRRKFLVLPLAFGTLETYFLPSAFEWSEDVRQSALLSKILATDFLWQIGW